MCVCVRVCVCTCVCVCACVHVCVHVCDSCMVRNTTENTIACLYPINYLENKNNMILPSVK